LPLPSWPELEAGGSSLAGLSGEQLAAFRERAVPEPGAALRETPRLGDERRVDVPSIVVCSSMSSNQIKDAVEAGHPWVGELAELRDVSYVDLPTGHWPMWSRARELAVILGDTARRSTRRLGGVDALREVPDLPQDRELVLECQDLGDLAIPGSARSLCRGPRRACRSAPRRRTARYGSAPYQGHGELVSRDEHVLDARGHIRKSRDFLSIPR
jgi:hypothetical protein